MTRVLIADDDIVVRDVVRRYLERDGLDVSIAHDGTEALRLLIVRSPQKLLTNTLCHTFRR